MEIKDFNILYEQYLEENSSIADDYMERINKHFYAYLKNPTDKQTETFRTLRDALILAFLADMLTNWTKQLKKSGNIAYDMAKAQTKALEVVKKKITPEKILELYKAKVNNGITDLTYVTESIKVNSERAIKDIQTNLDKTKKAISTELMEEFNTYGITYFTKTDGTRMSLANYVKTKSSDLVLSAFRNAYFAELLSKGVELVQVLRLPTNAIECDLCIPYDNKYLSLEEKEGYESVAEAKSFGLFHYYCFHYVVPVFEEDLSKGKIPHNEKSKKHKEYNDRKGNTFSLID